MSQTSTGMRWVQRPVVEANARRIGIVVRGAAAVVVRVEAAVEEAVAGQEAAVAAAVVDTAVVMVDQGASFQEKSEKAAIPGLRLFVCMRRLRHALRNSDDPAFGIFESELPHAIELRFEGHDNFGAAVLHRFQNFFDTFDLNEKGESASNWTGYQGRVILGNRLLVVEEDFDRAICHRSKNVRRVVG